MLDGEKIATEAPAILRAAGFGTLAGTVSGLIAAVQAAAELLTVHGTISVEVANVGPLDLAPMMPDDVAVAAVSGEDATAAPGAEVPTTEAAVMPWRAGRAAGFLFGFVATAAFWRLISDGGRGVVKPIRRFAGGPRLP